MKGFISYAHDDVAFLERFRVHLMAVEEAFGVTFWSDESLRAGHHWNDTILDAINQADVFLLLVSPSWIASKFIREDERPAIDARCAAIKGLIVPVVLMPCDWERVVGSLQIAPIEGRRPLPVTKWDYLDHGFDAARVQIHAAIRDHFHVTDTRNPETDVLVGLPPEHSGPVVIERDDRLDLDLSGDAADIAATKNAITRQLHAPNRQKALDLVEMLVKASNYLDPSWGRFVKAAKDLSGALDRPIEDIPAQLGIVWEASVRFASFLLWDKRLREAGSTDPAPLPDDIHDVFDDLVGSVAPWIRRFPGARELDDDRGAFLTRPELFAPSARVIRHAIASDLLTPASAQTLQGSIETAERDDPAQAAKAGTFSLKAARGLLTRCASYAAGILAGAVASGYPNESPLMKRIGRFLAGVETDGIALVVDMPRDIQHGMARTFERAAESALPRTSADETKVSPQSDSGRPPNEILPPDGFQEQAVDMILRGEAPPAAWRPFIRELNFSQRNPLFNPIHLPTNIFDSITNESLENQGKWFEGFMHKTNVEPHADKDGLWHSLRIWEENGPNKAVDEHTIPFTALPVSLNDATLPPYVEVHNIVSKRTIDISPLLGLTSLECLNVSFNNVKNFEVIQTLISLTYLDLSYTNINNIVFLRALSGLRYLDLSGSPVDDITPLRKLTALETLILGGSVVQDVASLASLTSLKSLDLTRIRPSGVDALRRPGLEIIEGAWTRRPRTP